MGRPERDLDLSNPLHEFAAELRKARMQAGNPSYLVMARRSGGVSRTALSEAAGGDHLPKWPTVVGFYQACRIPIPSDLLQRWERLQEQVKPANGRTNGNGHQADEPAPEVEADRSSRASRPRWLWPTVTVLLVLVTAVTVHVADVLMAPVHASGKPVSMPAGAVAIIVQNKVALGADTLIEDSSPAYLSSRPVPYCSKNGCVVPNTNMSSDTAVIADCQVTGTMMYNYDLNSSLSLTNTYRAASRLWYHIVVRNGASGYLSEVYIEAQYRGGMGLPVCKQ